MTMESNKRLTRSTSDKMIAGVCGGIAKYFYNVDSTLIRIIWAVITIFTFLGGGILLYIICAIIVPLDTEVNNNNPDNDTNTKN